MTNSQAEWHFEHVGQKPENQAQAERVQNYCQDRFDLILTREEQVKDQVVDVLSSRERETCLPEHVVSVDLEDTEEEEATLEVIVTCELSRCIQLSDDRGTRSRSCCCSWRGRAAGPCLLHTVCSY